MLLRSKGDRLLSKFERRVLKYSARIRNIFKNYVQIEDGPYKTKFSAVSFLVAHRSMTLWMKEEGTMRWIESTLQKGDVFLDIGANIGIYTISAAHRVGTQGRVIAAEPHRKNIQVLLENIELNNFSSVINVLTMPLSGGTKLARFNYKDLAIASSGHQLDSSVSPDGKKFDAELSEIVMTTTLDHLLEEGMIQRPNVIKIDVDGIELQILEGMRDLLKSPTKPKSIQVELNIGEQEDVIEFMKQHKYDLDHRHFTANGKEMLSKGIPQSKIAHNAVFKPSN